MKLIIQNGRIAATALDSYAGDAITAPPNFDMARMADYRVAEDGSLTLLPAASTLPPRAITYWAFRKRFTQPERVALELAAINDPAADPVLRQQSAAVRVYLADAAAAAWIDLDDEDTRTSVQALEAQGLLDEGRAAQIVDAVVNAAERPTQAVADLLL